MKMKKVLAIVLALAAILALFAGCGADADSQNGSSEGATTKIRDIYNEEVKIAVVLMSFGAPATIAQEAADAIRSAYPNLEINFFDSESSPDTQNTIMNECITQEYDAIIVEAMDPVAIGTVVTEAEQSGIPVITLNANCDAVHTLWIKNSSYDAGYKAAEGVVEALGGKGNVIIYDVPYVASATTNFGEGFEDYMKNYPDITILEHYYAAVDAFTQEGAFTGIGDMLIKYEDVDAIYTPEDTLALGAIQAINAAGRQDEGIVVWGNDCLPHGIDAIREGTLTGTCMCDRYSTYYAMFVATLGVIQQGITGVQAGYDTTPVVYLPFIKVTKENVDEIAPLTRWPGY